MSNVLVVNYGLNNIYSICNALIKLGSEPLVSTNPEDLKLASKIILPGVGFFSSAMDRLEKDGWKNEIIKCVKRDEIPFLGICLGMQLLAEKSEEGNEKEGLGLINAEIIKLKKKNAEEKVPHVGWNEIRKIKDCPILESIPDKTDFYFVHSYHFSAHDDSNVVGKTPYCGEFTSIINHNNIYGVQFHPEKSGKYGLRLLRNFLNLN